MFLYYIPQGTLFEVGRLSTINLLLVTRLDKLLDILQNYLIFFTKQATLMRRSTVLNLTLQLVFPGKNNPRIISVQWPLLRML
jgi:hypothetical protein